MLPQLLSSNGVAPFLSLQLPDNLNPDIHVICCAQLLSAEDLWTVWLVEANRMHKTSMSESQLTAKCRTLKITAPEFLKIVRDGFETKSIKYAKNGSKLDLSFGATGTKIILDLSSVDPGDGDVCRLLLQYGSALGQSRTDAAELKTKVEDLETHTGATSSSAFIMEQGLPSKHKKPKADPSMSAINPRSRVIKAPKGVVYDD